MHINPHRVAPTPHVPPYTSKPRNPQNQQKQSKPQVTNPVPFLTTLQQWFKPEKKGEVNSGN
jgi:hypothetical protein